LLAAKLIEYRPIGGAGAFYVGICGVARVTCFNQNWRMD